MTDNQNFTFYIDPGRKSHYNAGPYDKALRTPKYEIEISVPKHVRNQIELKQYLMGTEGNYLWVWDIDNRSTWPAFVTIIIDGVVQHQEI